MEDRKTILIIDDQEVNRVILKNIFKKKYDIKEFDNGKSPIEYIKQNEENIVAILLDIIMPEMSGIELLKLMRSEGIGKNIPVFLITSDASDENMYEGYELGVSDIIEKPFVPHFLKKRVESIVELYTMRGKQNIIIRELSKLVSNDDCTLEDIRKIVNKLV